MNDYNAEVPSSDDWITEIRLPSIYQNRVLKRSNMEIKFLRTYGLQAILTAIGGLWKSVGAAVALVIWLMLSIELDKKLSNVEPRYKEIISYETIFKWFRKSETEEELNISQ